MLSWMNLQNGEAEFRPRRIEPRMNTDEHGCYSGGAAYLLRTVPYFYVSNFSVFKIFLPLIFPPIPAHL